jgi:hypothetical protein
MPTYVSNSGAWVSVSGSNSAGTDINSVGAANQVLYKNSLNVATGSNNLTYDGANFGAYRAVIGPYAGSTTTANQTGLEIKNAGGTGDNNVAAISFHCQGTYGAHLHLRDDSYIGFGGWNASEWRWYVQLSTGNMTAAGFVSANSDPRLKEDLTPITSAVDKIKQLQGYRFKWKNMSPVGNPGKYDYGVIATDVEKIAPEIVQESAFESEDGDKYKTVAYSNLIPFLIEAIKEQNEIITNLKKDVDELKNKCYNKD